MGSHAIAWLVVVASVLVGLFALHRATRGRGWRRTRVAVALLLAVLLLVPASIPGYEGHYAPAFLVFTFEWLFQRSGNPRPAGVILLASTLLAAALMLLVAVTAGRRRTRSAPGKPDRPPAERRRPA